MTDQAPELLRQFLSRDPRVVFTGNMLDAARDEIERLRAFTRPPSERPVAQVREALASGEGDVLREIAVERLRQINQEGWTPEHDDAHDKCEMAVAAACYATAPSGVQIEREWVPPDIPQNWPWHFSWWKPAYHYRRNLVKAAALIVAEIERWDRLKMRVECPNCHNALDRQTYDDNVDHDYYEDGECQHCGGEGRVAGTCIDGCCAEQDDPYCEYCSHRCEFCNPPTKEQIEEGNKLRQILADALNKTPDDSLVLKKDEQSGPVSSPPYCTKRGQAVTARWRRTVLAWEWTVRHLRREFRLRFGKTIAA